MKTIVSAMLLMALLLSVCACAEGVPSISDELFAAAKEALGLLSLSHLWAATHLDARLRAMEFLAGA